MPRIGTCASAIMALAVVAVAQDDGRTISPLADADRERLAAQRQVVARLVAEHLATEFECCSSKTLDALQLLLERAVVEPGETYKLQSMGVVFGDVLAANTEWEWAIAEDSLGRDPCLRFRETTSLVFPLTVISKRVEDREQVDVRSLYAKVVRFADKLERDNSPLKDRAWMLLRASRDVGSSPGFSFGLVFQSATGQEVVVPGSGKPILLEVPPGSYHLRRIEGSALYGDVELEAPTEPVQIRPGYVTYAGDWKVILFGGPPGTAGVESVRVDFSAETIRQARLEMQLPDTDILVSAPGVEPHRVDLEPSP